MRYAALILVFTSVFLSPLANAADLFLHVFFKESPVQGVSVTIDDEVVGVTDRRGAFELYLGEGEHSLQLGEDSDPLANLDISAENGDEIEVQVIAKEGSQEAEVNIQRFRGDDQQGPLGFLAGRVQDDSGSPVVGAEVSAQGGEYSTTSAADGSYVLEMPRGAYRLSIEHPEYVASEIRALRVFSGVGVQAAVTLYAQQSGISAPTLPEDPSLEEVVILGTFNPSQNASDLERFATTVTDALDVTQLARLGDGDVAAALNRIVGVTVTDGKYANVRGLDGRYISSTLNGLLMPSTDPLRRDVQLDLFPSNILSGIEIQKSYSADLLGSTTGGSVKINTRGLPDERVFSVSTSGGFRQDVTGERVVSYRGSETDALGYDSDLRALSSDVLAATNGGRDLTICDPELDPRCTAPIQAAALAVTFEDDYNVRSKRATPDGSASVSYGDRIELESMDFGYYAALSYSHSTSDRGLATISDPLDASGSYQRSQENTSVNAYLVSGIEFRDSDEILSKTMVLRSTDDTTRQNNVIDIEDVTISEVILEFVERQFISQQFSGSHAIAVFDEESSLDWRIGYSNTQRDEPDRRTYQYRNEVLSPSELERRWSELDEDSIDVGVDYSLPLSLSDDLLLDLKVGAMWSDRSREVELYRFGIRPGSTNAAISSGIDENLEDVLSYLNFIRDRWRLNTLTTDTDSYESDEEFIALYTSGLLEFGADWTVEAGLRWEDFSQELRYPNQITASNDLSSTEVLPALNVSYRPNDEWQFRAGFSQTVSYPGLIERAESLVFDPATDDPIFGNPDLETSTIDNFDLRAEYYFSDEENVSIAVFRKDIDKPVERQVPDGSGSAASGITFRNAQEAELTGIEIDAYKNLLDLDDSLLFLTGNITWIDSKVTLDEDSLRLEGESAQGRELQGQSPWLANLQLGYDHFDTGQQVTLAVNFFDDRIFRVTRGGNSQPEFEKGRVLVDLSYEKLFGETLTFRAQIKNLLNDKVEYSQNNRVIESYEQGTSISLKLTYDFL